MRLVCVVDSLALKSKREGERVGDVFWGGGREGVAIMGHGGSVAERLEQRKYLVVLTWSARHLKRRPGRKCQIRAANGGQP
jgi:hypothetical protein